MDRGFYSHDEAQRSTNRNYVTRALGVEPTVEDDARTDTLAHLDDHHGAAGVVLAEGGGPAYVAGAVGSGSRGRAISLFGGLMRVGRFVGPLVEDVQDFTKPLQPPIDVLSAPVPVLNDLSQALGQRHDWSVDR